MKLHPLRLSCRPRLDSFFNALRQYIVSANISEKLWSSESKPFSRVQIALRELVESTEPGIFNFDEFQNLETIQNLMKELDGLSITGLPYFSFYPPSESQVFEPTVIRYHSQISRMHLKWIDAIAILDWSLAFSLEFIYIVYLISRCAHRKCFKNFFASGRFGIGKSISLYLAALYLITSPQKEIIPVYFGDCRAWLNASKHGISPVSFFVDEVVLSLKIFGINVDMRRFFSAPLNPESGELRRFLMSIDQLLLDRNLSICLIFDQVNSLDQEINTYPFSIITKDSAFSISQYIKSCTAFYCSSAAPIQVAESLAFCTKIKFTDLPRKELFVTVLKSNGITNTNTVDWIAEDAISLLEVNFIITKTKHVNNPEKIVIPMNAALNDLKIVLIENHKRFLHDRNISEDRFRSLVFRNICRLKRLESSEDEARFVDPNLVNIIKGPLILTSEMFSKLLQMNAREANVYFQSLNVERHEEYLFPSDYLSRSILYELYCMKHLKELDSQFSDALLLGFDMWSAMGSLIERALIDRFCMMQMFHLHGYQKLKRSSSTVPWLVSIPMSACFTHSYDFPEDVRNFPFYQQGLGIIPTVTNFDFVDWFVLDCITGNLYCCQVSLTTKIRDHINNSMKLFNEPKLGLERLNQFQRLFKKYNSVASSIPRYKNRASVDLYAKCFKQYTMHTKSSTLKKHFVYICLDSDARKIDLGQYPLGNFDSIIKCSLDQNLCVAGFLKNISVERISNNSEIRFIQTIGSLDEDYNVPRGQVDGETSDASARAPQPQEGSSSSHRSRLQTVQEAFSGDDRDDDDDDEGSSSQSRSAQEPEERSWEKETISVRRNPERKAKKMKGATYK